MCIRDRYTVEVASSDHDEVRAFHDDHPTTWPVLLVDDTQLAAFDVAAIPEIWIVDPVGSVVTRLVAPVTESDLSAALDTARNGQS